MSKEERAEVSRKNGAKSKGPVTPEGKEKVSKNALKTGEYAEKFSDFIPPQYAATCFEDPEGFEKLIEKLTRSYQPLNDQAHTIVRDIASARWEIERNCFCVTATWNYATIEAHRQPTGVPPELAGTENTARATRAVASGSAVASRLSRDNCRLQKHIFFLEKQLLFVHKNFQVDPPVIATPPEPTQNSGNKPNIVTSEIDHGVLAAYRRDFPNHNILIVPPAVTDDYDDLPDLRRKRT